MYVSIIFVGWFKESMVGETKTFIQLFLAMLWVKCHYVAFCWGDTEYLIINLKLYFL